MMKKTDIEEITEALLVVHYNLLCALSNRSVAKVEVKLESSLIAVQNCLNELKHIREYEHSVTVTKKPVWSLWRLTA
jgi:hypothetical protein